MDARCVQRQPRLDRWVYVYGKAVGGCKTDGRSLLAKAYIDVASSPDVGLVETLRRLLEAPSQKRMRSYVALSRASMPCLLLPANKMVLTAKDRAAYQRVAGS
jgi:hypothetical protein